MMRRFRYIRAYFLLACAVFISSAAYPASDKETANSCVRCHAALPGNSFVGAKSHDWTGSIHQKRGVTCDKCHGGNPGVSTEKEAHAGVLASNNPRSRVYYKNIPSTCGKCHGAEFYKFKQSRHYTILESTGKGAECVTCHGSMVTTVVTPETVEAVCERCHNQRMGVFPDVPKRARVVLLLLRESTDLLDADKELYRLGKDSAKAAGLRDAEASLKSAKLDWHTFNLDAVTGYLNDMYKKLIPRGGRQ
jgi:hypothetical protein